MFKSNHDGKDLNGYHSFKLPPANTWAPSYDGALEVVPVIMYGGNGGSGWGNVFTSSFLQSDTVVYDIHSFSYRGYEPNTEMGLPSETNILEDRYEINPSLHFFLATNTHIFSATPSSNTSRKNTPPTV